MIHAGLMIQTMMALISLVIISFYFTGLRLKLFHEFHFVFFNNKRSIGHMAHLSYISSQYKNLRKAMIIPKRCIREKTFLTFILFENWKTRDTLTQGCFICANKLGWNWPSGSGVKKTFTICQHIFTILPISLGKGHDPSFEETWILFTQECFLPSLVEIGPVELEKKIFKFFQCMLAILSLSPLGKVHGPNTYVKKKWIPMTKECSVPSLVEIGPVVLKKMKMWTVYR